jgi:outer membrane receptor protein involved in Fe transport
MAPHGVSGGVSWSWRRVNASINARWSDNVPTNTTGQNYVRHRTTLDLSTGYRLTNRYSLFASARNLTNAPYVNVQKPDSNPALWNSYQVFGVTWTFGIKGVF